MSCDPLIGSYPLPKTTNPPLRVLCVQSFIITEAKKAFLRGMPAWWCWSNRFLQSHSSQAAVTESLNLISHYALLYSALLLFEKVWVCQRCTLLFSKSNQPTTVFLGQHGFCSIKHSRVISTPLHLNRCGNCKGKPETQQG